MWGTVLKRDLLGEIREEDRFHNKEELKEYLKSEIEKQGENAVIKNLDVYQHVQLHLVLVVQVLTLMENLILRVNLVVG